MPQTFVILFLLIILLYLTYQFGSMQSELQEMRDNLDQSRKTEEDLKMKLQQMKSQIQSVETDNEFLKKKENDLEARAITLEQGQETKSQIDIPRKSEVAHVKEPEKTATLTGGFGTFA